MTGPRAVWALLASDTRGGMLARRLLPAAVLVPVGLEWSTWLGERAGLYGAPARGTVALAGNILAFVLLIAWCARRLFNADLRQRAAEEARRKSDEYFSVAFDQAPVAVAVLSREGRWLKVNRALCELVGHPEAELLGRHFSAVTHEEDLASCLDHVRQLVSGQEITYQSEKRYRHRDGHFVPVSFIVSAVVGEDGACQCLIAQIENIAERKRAEAETRFNAQRYRSLVEATTAIVWDMPPSGEFEVEQPAWMAFTGQTFEQLRGFGWLDAIHPDDQEETSREWAVAVANRSIYGVEQRVRTRDGEYREMMVRAVPILGEDGSIRQWIGLHDDITERKRAAQRLAASEVLLRQFIQHSPVAIAMLDTEMRYLQTSERWIQEYRLAGQEIIGRSHYDVFPEVSDAWKAIHQRVLAGAVERCDEDAFPRPDGTVDWLQWEARPWRTSSGEIGGLIFFTQIITERKRAEEELRWKTAFLEAQVNSTIDGIIVVDEAGKKILQNQRANEIFEIPAAIAEEIDDAAQIAWVTSQARDPVRFAEKVRYLYAHPEETSRDEIELKNGSTLDRYAAPVLGADGRRYGRIWTFRDITERVKNEQSLRLLSSAVEQAQESIIITDARPDLPGPQIVFVNPAFTRLTGYSAAEALGKTPRILQGPRTDQAVLDRLRKSLAEGESFAGEVINYRKDGSEYYQEWHVAPIYAANGKMTHFVAIQRDITVRRRIEAQLFESQKMETVGKLAGGVAHEFNSIMTAIIGRSEMLLSRLPAAEAPARGVAEIRRAAERAAVLTRQLLAYGRKQVLQPEALNLNMVLTDMEATLRHLLKTDIQLRFVPAAGLGTVKADLGQLQQVIMNMAMNAADAMPSGGEIIFETANALLEPDDAPDAAAQGSFVTLSITDTGLGMSEDVRSRVFEPFFTTKGIGQGAGLGLSTCYGIVKQSNGHITLHSEPGRGAMFKICLPQADPAPPRALPRLALPDVARGKETVLLVEDDAALREMASALLRRLGYTVLTAANGLEALTIVRDRGTEPIDLLFTDVMMPQMNGQELSQRVAETSPVTRLLFTSSYTEDSIVYHGGLRKGAALLKKPYTPSVLARRVREALDATPPGHS